MDELFTWGFEALAPAMQTGEKDYDVKFAGDYSLGIHGSGTGGVAYWLLPALLDDQVPVGATLTVSAKVKTENLTGNGVWIWIQANPNEEPAYSVTSDVYRIVKGTNDWTEISQKIHCYPNSKPKMLIWLGIDGTGTGDVWFDDIKVGFNR